MGGWIDEWMDEKFLLYIHVCLHRCYLKVEVYEKHEGEVSKTTEFCVNAQDSTLEEILKNSLSTQVGLCANKV